MRRRNALWLFALVYSSLGFSMYFALGVVADRALDLTPFVFLAAGLLFMVTMLTYGEGASMFRERGGSSTFARYAFNELASFVAGWAILIDYLVVVALAAVSAAHYLDPVPGLNEGPVSELGVAIAIIAGVALLNIRGVTGRGRAVLLAVLAFADVALQALIVAIGLFIVWNPALAVESLDPFTGASTRDAIYAVAIALLAYAGLEAGANLAPDVNVSRKQLRRILWSGAITLPVTYAGMAVVALLAVPVLSGPDGYSTELGSTYIEAPFLGVVAAFDPAWLAATAKWLVVLVAVPTLAWAANISMLGVSRHIYALAVNRQIPSWLGKLGRSSKTPHIAIVISALIAIGMLIPRDIVLLAEIYAFGATLAIAIAHLSIIRLRLTAADLPRPFRVPFNIGLSGGRSLPLPAVFGALFSIGAFISVLALHEKARLVGGGWMLFGLIAYAVYRSYFEGTSLTERVTVPEADLTKPGATLSYHTILMPVFGGGQDDDVVRTAGRLAAAASEGRASTRSRLDLIHVVEVPMSRSLEAPLPGKEIEQADDALRRAVEVASEHPDVDATTRVLRARTVGAGIVSAAREGPVETIIIGAQPPTTVRGGAIYGGLGGDRPPEVGPVAEYVLSKAPCRVLLIAPPELPERRGAGAGAEPAGARREPGAS